MFSGQGKLVWVLLLITSVISCRNTDTDEPDVAPVITAATPYYLKVPEGFPQPNLSRQNPLTVEGVDLGRRLYSDPILSSNGLSCSSCHMKSLSYSAPAFNAANGFRFSVPPHVNLAFKTYYNWTGSIEVLDTLCMGDFEAEFFNTNAADLYQKLNAHLEYPKMFRKAFGITNLNNLTYHELKIKICYAISQYMRTLVSADSKFDRYRAQKTSLTQEEYAGMLIFFSERGDCFHCHSDPLFSDNSFHNNGLSNVFNGFDKGRALVTNSDKDLGKFLTPTLRNVARTAPYMHDGRYATLEQVVEFYSSGVKNSPYIDPIMNKRENISNLQLSDSEKKALVAFLKTLTDEEFVK